MAFGEYWDTCEYNDGVLNYNQVRVKVGHFWLQNRGHQIFNGLDRF